VHEPRPTRRPVLATLAAFVAALVAVFGGAAPVVAQDRIVFTQPSVSSLVGGSWNLLAFDAEGDTATDLVLWRTTDVTRFMVGTNTEGSFAFTAFPSGPLIDPTVRFYHGDFNNDGLEDLLVHRTTDGRFQVGLRSGSGWGPFTDWSIALGFPASVQVLTGDFSGDGLDDVMVYDAAGGGVAMGWNVGSQFTFLGLGSLGAGVNWRFTVGRFTGQSRDELAGHRPSDGALFLMALSGVQLVSSQWGTVSPTLAQVDQLLAGDFNRDGRSDVLAYEEATGDLAVGLSTGASFELQRWGALPGPGTWRLATGEFVRPLQADVAAYDAATSTLWLGDNKQRQCSNGFDDDLDGLADYPADPQCDSAADNDEGRSCGLGGELVLALGLLRRWRRGPGSKQTQLPASP
jgi:hypothetical protein